MSQPGRFVIPSSTGSGQIMSNRDDAMDALRELYRESGRTGLSHALWHMSESGAQTILAIATPGGMFVTNRRMYLHTRPGMS